jgi:hypothetical protein
MEENRVSGVKVKTAEGEEFIPARRVIFNIPIQEIFKYVDDKAFPADFVARIKTLYGYGSLSPYFGLSSLPVPEDHARRLMKTPCVVPRSEGFDWDVYMAWNIESFIAPSCAPPGKHLFTAYLPLTEAESRDRALVMKVVRAVPEFLESVYPGFKGMYRLGALPGVHEARGCGQERHPGGEPEARRDGTRRRGAVFRRRYRSRLRGGHGLRLLQRDHLCLGHNRPKIRRRITHQVAAGCIAKAIATSSALRCQCLERIAQVTGPAGHGTCPSEGLARVRSERMTEGLARVCFGNKRRPVWGAFTSDFRLC